MTIGPESDAVVDATDEFVSAGYDHIYFHQIGPDQDAFFDMWDNDLARSLRQR